MRTACLGELIGDKDPSGSQRVAKSAGYGLDCQIQAEHSISSTFLTGVVIPTETRQRIRKKSEFNHLEPIRKLAGRAPTPGNPAAWEPPLLGFRMGIYNRPASMAASKAMPL
jgi:hypothetical protein